MRRRSTLVVSLDKNKGQGCHICNAMKIAVKVKAVDETVQADTMLILHRLMAVAKLMQEMSPFSGMNFQNIHAFLSDSSGFP